MKILLSLPWVLLILTIISCSSDSETPNSTSDILPSKIINTDPDGTYTSEFNYSGTKLSSIKLYFNNTLIRINNWTYSNDLISEVKVYNSSGNLIGKDEFTYNSQNNIIGFVSFDYENSFGERAVYTYNSNGTVGVEEYRGSLSVQNEWIMTKTISFMNGEVATVLEQDQFGSTLHQFNYDNKNSPYKNILGADKTAIAAIGTLSSEINHNLIEHQFGTFSTTYTYTYNSNNYPTFKQKNLFNLETWQFYY